MPEISQLTKAYLRHHYKSLMGSLTRSLWNLWCNTRKQLPESHPVYIDAETAQQYTLAALNERVEQISDCLSDAVERQVVAFALPNGVEWLALFLALQRRGAIAMPLDVSTAAEATNAYALGLEVSFVWRDAKLVALKPKPEATDTLQYAFVKLTSGSTGIPKRIFCTGRHLIHDGSQVCETMQIGPHDHSLGIIPLGHSYGMGNLVMPLLMQGTTIVGAARFLPTAIPVWIKQHRVTVLPSVPDIFRMLATLPGDLQCETLRLVISAGGLLKPEIAVAFKKKYGVGIHNFYGSSETGGICFDRSGDATLSGRAVGTPLVGVNVTVSSVGVRVKSLAVTNAGGAYTVKDSGELNELGELRLFGRRGNMINIGGKKVHAAEIETPLRTLGAVRDLLIWKRELDDRETFVIAIDTDMPETDLKRFILQQIPKWKVPKFWYVSKNLPRTGSGKLDRKKIETECK